jgi:hypothetical protein
VNLYREGRAGDAEPLVQLAIVGEQKVAGRFEPLSRQVAAIFLGNEDESACGPTLIVDLG